MNDWLKRQLYILIVSLAMLTRLIVFCILTKFSVAETVWVCVYAFCIMPSFNYVFDFFNRLTADNAVKTGAMLGVTLGFIGFILPIILAPVFMVINYCKVGKVLINKHRAKNRNKK